MSGCTTIARRLLNESERGKDCGRNERLDVDRLRLPANLIRFCPVSDLLRTGIHVALTARRELYSRSIPVLEEPQSPDEERDEEEQPEH